MGETGQESAKSIRGTRRLWGIVGFHQESANDRNRGHPRLDMEDLPIGVRNDRRRQDIQSERGTDHPSETFDITGRHAPYQFVGRFMFLDVRRKLFVGIVNVHRDAVQPDIRP